MHNTFYGQSSLQYFLIGTVIFITLIIITLILIYLILRSPFHYPYFTHYFDVSGKRNPQIDDLIDTFLIKEGFPKIQRQHEKIQLWKENCQDKVEKSILKKHRIRQYKKEIDDDNAFIFCLIRQQTRYRQRNFVRYSYKVNQIVNKFTCSYEYLEHRNQELKFINYECTLREYHSKNQRKLMTKGLRKKIITRDNYTCQICGKYMPDEVGLHVDHIIPVSKGGKTVLSNLQVLCSKCNGNKSNKSSDIDISKYFTDCSKYNGSKSNKT